MAAALQVCSSEFGLPDETYGYSGKRKCAACEFAQTALSSQGALYCQLRIASFTVDIHGCQHLGEIHGENYPKKLYSFQCSVFF